MPVVVILAVVAAAAMIYWLARRRRPAPDRLPTRGSKGAPRPTAAPGRKAEAPAQPAPSRYGAVEIQARQAACGAALALRGRRYLAHQAPALPLPGCTAAQCSCSFVKLSDRRTEDRRLEHAGLSASLFLASNRRDQPGRREDD